MKFSKLLLFGIAGAALLVIVKKMVNSEKHTAEEDDLFFDTDFLTGSKKLHLDIPDHVNPSWYRAARYQAEDSDTMFI